MNTPNSTLFMSTRAVRSTVTTALSLGALALSSVALSADALINLKTTQAGIHEVTYQALLASGADLAGIDAHELTLVSQGSAVPIQVLGGPVFGTGSSIRFIASQVDTLYTDTNVYTLNLGGAQESIGEQASVISPRIPFANSYLAREAYAPQANYSFTSPDSNDPWYAKRMVAVGHAMSETITMTLDEVAPGGNDGLSGAKMSVDVWGRHQLAGAG